MENGPGIEEFPGKPVRELGIPKEKVPGVGNSCGIWGLIFWEFLALFLGIFGLFFWDFGTIFPGIFGVFFLGIF